MDEPDLAAHEVADGAYNPAAYVSAYHWAAWVLEERRYRAAARERTAVVP